MFHAVDYYSLGFPKYEFLTISAKLRASSDAPPTSAPSTSGWLISSLAFAGFTLPPY